MTTVPELRILDNAYWKHKYAVVIMSHTKAGFPIVKALLDMGMYVIAVAHQFKQNEMLRHLLTRKQERNYFTKQVDLHRIISINSLLQELKLEAYPVKLFLCLIPRIDDKELGDLFEKANATVLQTVLEIDDMGVAALFYRAAKLVLQPNFSHMWCLRFYHKDPTLVHNYMEHLLTLADKAPAYLNVNLTRNPEKEIRCECHEKSN